MKTYTTEEKEQIMRIPLNADSFERPSFNYDDFSEEYLEYQDLISSELWVWNHELIPHLNRLREMYFNTRMIESLRCSFVCFLIHIDKY